ncbi:uncharacterized protein [Haliotis asinina]|uniref:uncharacterized protein n=1 Tax=Haliotis asinina TaxID=109174 RepID=UPI003531916F
MAERGDNSQEELEYFSAEEESVNLSGADEFVKVQGFSMCTPDIRQPGMTIGENITFIHNTASHHSEQKQGHSKKQKRRRRNKLKSLQPEFVFPYSNSENMDYYSEFMGCSSDILRSHIRNIPTLFKLCVDAMTKVSKSPSVCPVVKDVLSYMQEDQKLMNIQLSWMHQLLYYFEHTDGEFESMILESDVDVASRNVWNNGRFDHHLWTLTNSPYNYLGNPDSTILLFTNQSSHLRWKMDFLNMSAVTSVVASVTESMLPAHVSAIRLHHSSQDCRSESQLIQKVTESLVSIVRRKFRKRYPKIYKHLFDRALPYVFWARGNISFAAECFMRFAQTKEEGPYKAMILNEAARLYAQNGESSKAYRLYMESPGARDEDTSTHSSDLILQKHMLMASVYDQGMMTPAKAALADDTWKAAMIHLDASSPGISVTRPVESFLCFHCGTAAGSVQDRLEDCVKLAERLVGYCGDLLLHLSLLKALLGDDEGSTKGYKALTFSLSSRKEVRNPWQPVLDHVQNHGMPKFMKVIWRTQPGHLCIVTGLYSFEGDHLSGADLNLRLTDAGFLTADFQMVLPPIRALNLDPYTGFNFHTPRQTHAWYSVSEVSHDGSLQLSGLNLVPTLCELYSDETGNTVHFLAPYAYETSALTDWKTEIKPVTLLWTGANGKRARVNLSKLVKLFLKKKAIFEIFSNPDRPKKWKEEMMATAEYCYARGYNPGFSTVTFVHDYLWDKVVTSSQYRDMHGKLSKPELRKTADVPQNCQSRHRFLAILTEYFPYRDTLYLSLYIPGEDNCVMVFVDCTNEATFHEPVITTDFSYKPWSCAVDDLSMSSIQVHKAVKKHCQFPQDEIMWHVGRRSQISAKVMVVYGKGGRVLKIFSQDTMPTPYVLGNKLYGLSPEQTRVKCNPVTADEILSEEFPVIITLLFGGNKVMAVTNSAIYFLNPDSLQTLIVTEQQDSYSLKVSEDGRFISFPPGSSVKILEQKKMEEKTRLAFGIGSTLMFVDVTDDGVQVIMELKLPGPATEVYSINAQVGFLVSFKMQHHNIQLQREHVFHYSHHGKILGILPFLGPGPRCFCVEYLKGQEEVTDRDCGRRGWHVFMRDGHEGIMGVRL